MKIEFKQKQTQEFLLNNLKETEFISLATEASRQLGWIIGDVNETGFVAYTHNGVFAWNAEVRMKINNGLATLQSRSMGDEFIDVRGNKENIQNFISAFKDLKRQHYPAQQHQYVNV
jgi:rhomboid protease GluP